MPLSLDKIITRQVDLGLTKTEVGRRMGLSPSNVGRIFAGDRLDPTLSTAERLAAALECSLGDLLACSPEDEPGVTRPTEYVEESMRSA